MADPPTIMRLRAVLSELSGYVGQKGTAKQKRMIMIVRRIANDVCEELQESDQETLSAYFQQMGQVISWIGTGEYGDMSDQLREWIEPRAEGILLAIEASGTEDNPLPEIPIDAIDRELDEELVPVPLGVDSQLSGDNPGTGRA